MDESNRKQEDKIRKDGYRVLGLCSETNGLKINFTTFWLCDFILFLFYFFLILFLNFT